MISRRQSPWIHRFSRPIIGAVAAVGIADTGYLTSVKLAGNGVACSSESCNQVLSSPYANVFGMPLTLFGMLAYVLIAVLALVPLLLQAQSSKKKQSQWQNVTWWGLFLLATSMAVFSGYLMYLLAFVIKAPCPFCIVSAICAVTIWIVTMLGKEWEDVGQLLFRGLAVALLTLMVTLGIYANVGGQPEAAEVPTTTAITTLEPPNVAPTKAGWIVTSKSGAAELELAKHLEQTGAKMYGGFYCSHCYEQKQLFGREAFKASINYIECHPEGKNPQTELCQKEGVTGFPTWDIKGQKYPGVQLPEKLAELSGYQGPKDFQYSKLMPGFNKK